MGKKIFEIEGIILFYCAYIIPKVFKKVPGVTFKVFNLFLEN